MRTKAVKIISTILALSFMCLLFAACGEKKQPAYVLVALEGDSLVESYKSFFELDGNSIKEVKEYRYDAIMKGNSNYNLINFYTYEYDVVAKNANPADWEFTRERKNAPESYNRKNLIKFLRLMKLPYYGDLKIVVKDFDGFYVIEVTRLEGGVASDIQTAIFRNGHQLSVAKGVSLKAIKNVYKKSI